MDNGVRAQESTLSGMLAAGEQLTMPPYQRSYSWNESEALDLINDLREASETGVAHFIGAVVLVRSQEDGTLEIVDGQQRLTTLTILLAVLRDMAPDKAEADKLHALIADGARPVLGEQANWRLTLNDVDGHFFRETIQTRGTSLNLEDDPGESESQRRITANTAAIISALKAMTPAQRSALSETTRNGCMLVRVVVSDRDSGFRVFRVLNTRGKAPNAHDIIKTELFERAKLNLDEAKIYAEQWAEHEATLGGGAFDKLLQHIRSIYDKQHKGDLLAGFRKAVLGKITARDFLDRILPLYVDAYKEILTGDVKLGAHSETVTTYLHRLRTLEHSGWRAPALKYLVERRNNAKTAPEFFRRLERLGFMIQLIIHDRDQRTKRYRKVMDAVASDRQLFARNGPLIVTRDEARRIKDRLLGRFATFGQRRSMALRINAALEGGKTLPPESDATVEHVLPRNIQADSYWLTTWPDPAKRRELCDTLGNFILLPNKVNQKAGRMDYRAKKEIYFNGGGGVHFALTRDLEHQDAWTADIVKKRTKDLADILLSEWEIS